MKKKLGLFSLALINASILFLIYLYVMTIASTRIDNIFHVAFEPSGMQLLYYILSLPLFLILGCFSLMHRYYFNVEKPLFLGLMVIWFSNFILITFVDSILHYSSKWDFLYYGTLIISLFAFVYVIYSTCCQFIQLRSAEE